MATKFKLSITPVVGVRIRRIGKGEVEVDFICSSADGQPVKTHRMREGELWSYDLHLDGSGWHDEVRRDDPGGMGGIAQQLSSPGRRRLGGAR